MNFVRLITFVVLVACLLLMWGKAHRIWDDLVSQERDFYTGTMVLTGGTAAVVMQNFALDAEVGPVTLLFPFAGLLLLRSLLRPEGQYGWMTWRRGGDPRNDDGDAR